MSQYKRTSKKTGKYSRSTTTVNSSGRVTKSNSSKPPGSGTRRTQSWNTQTGKTRETYTTKMGGGWTRRTSRTLNPTGHDVGPKKLTKRETENILLFFTVIFYIFKFLWTGLGKIFRILRNRSRK